MLILVGIITFFSTLAGGLFALRFRNKSHLILAFSAGAVMGVVFYDLLPEAFSLSSKQYGFDTTAFVIAAGFIVYMILDRFTLLHSKTKESHMGIRGKLGASSLSAHSFFDGLAIGIAFHFSATLGIFIAMAVITHDFSDGVNTVSIVLKDNGRQYEAFKWLLVDALTPTVGIIATLFFKVPESLFGMILALFTGFFLYIGASDLLPESQYHHPSWKTLLLTFLGMMISYIAVRFM